MSTEQDIQDLVKATNALTLVAEGIIANGGGYINFEKSISNDPAFSNVVNVVSLACDVDVDISGVTCNFASGVNITMPALTVGTDYAIYATETELIASANFTVPDGYTAQNSRRIGGFHYGDNRIYPRSFWDLKFKPECNDPRGMVRTFQGFWADIYLLNTTPDLLGTSAYNAQIADGASTPKKPAVLGGDGVSQYANFTQYTATKIAYAYGKRLPAPAEFYALALGAVGGHSAGVDSIKTIFDVDSRSDIDCEQVSGHLYQFGCSMASFNSGTISWKTHDPEENAKTYVHDLKGVMFGGNWSDYNGESGTSGASCTYWISVILQSQESMGARCICNHYQGV
ncbi:major tropism determinant [Psychromonas hadalis]|uniref:phage major tropism determinant n=1 Tax=Psychromonas hadalis TaxID=211669 RepID=UPI0003B43D5B|nr:major tropism determinant [Psychromonas hadalis]